MFGKNMEKLKAFLGSQSEMQGELVTRGILRLDGSVTGKVQSDEVILSETAVIKGDIIAKRIIAGGKVEGILRATDLVIIGSKGKVKGNIFTNKLLVMEGGEFNGQIEMKTEKPTFLDFESQNQEIALDTDTLNSKAG